MKYLVVVSDDFGFTSGINEGTIDAVKSGILQEMSFMFGSPGSKQAVELVKTNNLQKQVGIHLTLNNLEKSGKYLRSSDYESLLAEESEEKLSLMIRDELEGFESIFGFHPSHINSHKNVHQHKKLRKAVAEYAVKHGIFVRRTERFRDKNIVQETNKSEANEYFIKHGARMTDYIFEHIAGSYDEAYSGFLSDLRKVEDDSVTEIFFHAGMVDEQLKKYSSLTTDRERDQKLLKDDSFVRNIQNLGFNIAPFHQIPK